MKIKLLLLLTLSILIAIFSLTSNAQTTITLYPNGTQGKDTYTFTLAQAPTTEPIKAL